MQNNKLVLTKDNSNFEMFLECPEEVVHGDQTPKTPEVEKEEEKAAKKLLPTTDVRQ